jgi:uncharacterized protein
MQTNSHATWLNQIVDFIGEYSRLNPGYSPQNLAAALEKEFRIRAEDAEKLTQLIEQEVHNKLILASMELNLTFNCNLTCEYCFVHNKSPEDRMSFTTAKTAIDVLLEHAYPKVTVTLFGGEPLLEFELIKNIVPYTMEKAQQKGISVEWAITTNGTLITEEILRFFARHQIMLLLSIDGGPETHDRYRRTKSGEGTWLKIVNLIPLVKQYQGWLGARVTVAAEAVSSMKEDFKHLVELGINQFIIAPAQGARCWSEEEIGRYGFNLRQIYQDYLALKQTGTAIFIEEFEADEKEEKGWGCRAGVTSIAVAPNGDVSPCSKLLGLTNEKGKCIVGNVHSDINYDLLKPFQMALYQQPSHCKLCTDKCTGGCFAVNFEQTGNHFTPSIETCLFWAVKQECSLSKKLSTTNN